MMKTSNLRSRAPRGASAQCHRPSWRSAPEVNCTVRVAVGDHVHSGRLCNIDRRCMEVLLQREVELVEDVVTRLPDLAPRRAKLEWIDGRRALLSFGKPLPAAALRSWLDRRRTLLTPEHLAPAA